MTKDRELFEGSATRWKSQWKSDGSTMEVQEVNGSTRNLWESMEVQEIFGNQWKYKKFSGVQGSSKKIYRNIRKNPNFKLKLIIIIIRYY